MSETRKPVQDRLEEALAVEYSAIWFDVYNEDTSTRMGKANANINITPVLGAIKRAGLKLVEA